MSGSRRAFWLPPSLPAPTARFEPAGGGTIEVPETTPALVFSATARLREAHAALRALPTETVLKALEDVVDEWRRPDCADRAAAEDAFAAGTAMPRASCPFGPMLEPAGAGALRAWLRAEVSPVEALDGFAAGPGGAPLRASGPALAVHVLSGNVPLAWLPGVLACLLMRTACLLKPASADPLTAPLFAAALARRLPALGDALAVLPWAGGDVGIETEALRGAGAVFVYGGDDAIAGILARVPPEATVSAHGPRAAAGVIGREVLAPGRLEPVAAAAARDALLYDGRGCLTLSTVWVEHGGLMKPAEAVATLARALADAVPALPAGRPDRDGAAITQTWRARVRARAAAGKPAACHGSAGDLAWTVLYDGELPPPGTPLVRTLWVAPVPELEAVPGRLAGAGIITHAVALATSDKRRTALAGPLAAAGATRITTFGRLQAPPLDWPADGASPFKRHLRWSRLEA